MRPEFRRTIAWLLVAFLGLQGIWVGFSGARGPAHIHRSTASAPILVLEDVRRGGHLSAGRSAFHGWSGHSHETSSHHHHVATDRSVVILDADRAASAAAEESTLALDVAVAAFIALVMTAFLWTPVEPVRRRALHAPWQPSFANARLIERPPQVA